MDTVPHVSASHQIMFLLFFLFCSPTWVEFGWVLAFEYPAGFWLCGGRFRFWMFPSIFHSPDMFHFELVHVSTYLGKHSVYLSYLSIQIQNIHETMKKASDLLVLKMLKWNGYGSVIQFSTISRDICRVWVFAYDQSAIEWRTNFL